MIRVHSPAQGIESHRLVRAIRRALQIVRDDWTGSRALVTGAGVAALAALLWWSALCLRRRFPRPRLTAQLCALSLLGLYELVATTLGSYNAYARLHLTIDPLMLIVVVGTLFMLLGGGALFGRQPTRRNEVSLPTTVPSSRSESAEEQSAA